MKEGKFEDKNKQEVNNQIKTPEKPWELSAEDSSFFDRKFKALEYFGNKLNNDKEKSAEFSSKGVSNLEQRVNNLNLDSYNSEEINAIKQQINNLENQKQEVINHGEEDIKKVDVESSSWSLSSEDKSFFDRKFKALGEFKDKINSNKETSLEKSNVEYTPFEEVEKIEDMEKNDSLKLSHQPDITNKIKPEVENTETKETDEEIKPIEKLEEKPLEPGDEVYRNGVFYKIHDFMPDYEKDLHGDYLNKKMLGQIDRGMSESEWTLKTKQERTKAGTMPGRQFRAVITEGGFGGGKGGLEHFTEDQITRVTPELKEKILKMKKESGRGEQFATGE